jgi:hypothetical protein
LVLVPWVLEKRELSIGFQLQQSIILTEWYPGNQSILETVHRHFFLKCYLLADKWRSMFLYMELACAPIRLFLPSLCMLENTVDIGS